jgi:hypothetical protein
MSRRFEADTNALQTTGWSGPPDADDFPVRMKPLWSFLKKRTENSYQ